VRTEYAPVTERAADEEPRRATVETSGSDSSRPAASVSARAAAAKPDDDDPNPMFDGNEFSLSSLTAWSMSARSRTCSTTASMRSAARPSTGSPPMT